MIFSSLLARSTDAECYSYRRAQKLLDVNFDGIMDVIGERMTCGQDHYHFLNFGTLLDPHFSYDAEEDFQTGTLSFRTGWQLGWKAAVQPGAKLFAVGNAVRLLDGRKGDIQGFTFTFDKDYQNEDIRAEILIDGAKDLIDVSLLDIIPQKK